MITLTEINQSNWEQCISLSVFPEQKNFVATNVFSLAQSKIFPDMLPLGICNDGQLVGFAMIGYETGRSWIIRFMIDSKHQKKGYGKEALDVLIKFLYEKYGKSPVRLSVEPENTVAIKLYESFGFIPTGEMEEGERVFELAKT